ncbi:hypothetical protein G7K_4007-t1 [Saitoella complicata NRRL Y-17804]|uniref:PH domain-containing protein n=1 Tax=Saitoella complicata (strain BCRC 22490 / CBS 7301 / JCM 7358 / NBRC 10748 / NRRL Y-17804) TaxID=698492 RepID=A0A0E9NKG0_SAICN|nr:hypothetical protein G7K_4007-t1 [Saitoella complicata NRRL Y-17804]
MADDPATPNRSAFALKPALQPRQTPAAMSVDTPSSAISTASTMYNDSPSVVKSKLESKHAEIIEQLNAAGMLGIKLTQQKQKYEERIKQLEEEKGERLSPEAQAQLEELAREAAEAERETRRLLSGSLRDKENESPTRKSLFASQGTVSPSKNALHPRGRRSNRDSKIVRPNDIEFAAELGQNMIEEIRRLNAALAERNEELQEFKSRNMDMENMVAELQSGVQRLRSEKHDDEEKIWDLGVQVQTQTDELQKTQEKIERLEAETARSAREREEKNQAIDQLQQREEELAREKEDVKAKHELELANLQKREAFLREDNENLERHLQELRVELESRPTPSKAMSVEEVEFEAFDDDNFFMDNAVDEYGPMGSPVKGTPSRNATMESETARASLAHAYRMLKSQRIKMNQERAEKAELRRRIAELEGETDTANRRAKKAKATPAAGKHKKGLSKSAADLLGDNRRPRSEVLSMSSEFDDSQEWDDAEEEEHLVDSDGFKIPRLNRSTAPRFAPPAQPPFAPSVRYSTASEFETDAYQTANDASEVDDGMATETDAYRTGAESIMNSEEEEGEVTETDANSPKRMDKPSPNAYLDSDYLPAQSSSDKVPDDHYASEDSEPPSPTVGSARKYGGLGSGRRVPSGGQSGFRGGMWNKRIDSQNFARSTPKALFDELAGDDGSPGAGRGMRQSGSMATIVPEDSVVRPAEEIAALETKSKELEQLLVEHAELEAKLKEVEHTVAETTKQRGELQAQLGEMEAKAAESAKLSVVHTELEEKFKNVEVQRTAAENKLAELQKTVQDSDTRANEAVNELARTKEALHSEIAALRKTLAEQTGVSQALQEEVNTRRDEIQKLKLTLNDKTSALDALRSDVTTKDARLKGLAEQLATEHAVLAATRQQLVDEEARGGEAAHRLEASEIEIQQKASEIQRLSQELSVQRAAVATLEQKLVDGERKVVDSTAQLDALSTELESAKKALEVKSFALTSTKTELQKLQSESSGLREEMDSLKQTLTSSVTELTTLREQHGNVTSALTVKESELCTVRQNLQEKTDDVEKTLADILIAKKAIVSLQEQLSDAKEKEEGLVKDIAAKNTDAATTNELVSSLQDKIKNVEEQLAEISKQNGALQAELAKRRDEWDSVQSNLAEKDAKHKNSIEEKELAINEKTNEITKLSSEVAAAAVTIEDLRKQISEGEKEAATLVNEVEVKSAEAELAKADLHQKSGELAALVEREQVLQQQLVEANESIAGAHAQIDTTKAQAREAAEQVSLEHNVILKRVKDEHDVLEQALAEAKSETATSRAGLEAIIANKNAQLDAAKVVSSENEEQRRTLETLYKRVADAEKEATTLKAERSNELVSRAEQDSVMQRELDTRATQIVRLLEKVSSLTARVVEGESLKADLDDRTAELEDAQSTLTDLSEKLRHTAGRNVTMRKEVEASLNEARANAETISAKLRETQAELVAAVESAETLRLDLQSKIESLSEELKVKSMRLQNVQAELAASGERHSEVALVLDDVKYKLGVSQAAYQHELSQLQAALTDKSKQQNILQEALDRKASEVEGLSKQLLLLQKAKLEGEQAAELTQRKLQREVEAASECEHLLKADLDVKTDEIEELQASITELKSIVDSLRGQVDEATAATARTEDKFEAARQELEGVASKVREQAASIDATSAQRAKIAASLEAERKLSDGLRKELLNSQYKIDTLTGDVAAGKGDTAKVRSELVATKNELERARSENQSSMEALEEARVEIASLKAELQRLTAQLRELQESVMAAAARERDNFVSAPVTDSTFDSLLQSDTDYRRRDTVATSVSYGGMDEEAPSSVVLAEPLARRLGSEHRTGVVGLLEQDAQSDSAGNAASESLGPLRRSPPLQSLAAFSHAPLSVEASKATSQGVVEHSPPTTDNLTQTDGIPSTSNYLYIRPEAPTAQPQSMGPPMAPTKAPDASRLRAARSMTAVRSNATATREQRGSISNAHGHRRSVTDDARSRRTSLSSFRSELDERLRLREDDMQDTRPNGTTDPKTLQILMQTMIGEYMWKYTRKTLGQDLSNNRHARFFWVHPYTQTLHWSDKDPQNASGEEVKSKSTPIESVSVVVDENPYPPGLHHESIVITTRKRSIKFTAQTRSRHEAWYSALSYLINRSNSGGMEGNVQEAAPAYSEDDVREFNPSYSRRVHGSLSSRGTTTLSSPSTSAKSTPQLQQNAVFSRISSIFRANTLNATPTQRSTALATETFDASDAFDSGDHHHHHHHNHNSIRDRGQLENVRACCNGKHDVSTLSRRGRHGRQEHTVV